jgi:hypothetical protein
LGFALGTGQAVEIARLVARDETLISPGLSLVSSKALSRALGL